MQHLAQGVLPLAASSQGCMTREMIHHVCPVPGFCHAWRQHPGQEDAPTSDLAFVMRPEASASPKCLKSRQQGLQPLALKGCWQTARTASLTRRGREWLK